MELKTGQGTDGFFLSALSDFARFPGDKGDLAAIAPDPENAGAVQIFHERRDPVTQRLCR